MRYRIAIDEMLAVHAKRAVFTALAGVPGVMSAEVEMGEAVVTADATVTEECLRAALRGVGLSARRVTKELPVA